MAARSAVAALGRIGHSCASPGGGNNGFFFAGGGAMLVVPGLVFGLAHKGIARAAGPSGDNFAFDDTPRASRGETGVLLRPGEEEPAAAAGVSVTAAVSAAVPAAV